MATETYRWFRPDSKLRNGTTILNFGDGAELSPFALMTRALCQALGLPAGGTRFLFDYGTATDTFVYARCPELLWPLMSGGGALTADEIASAVTTLPAGWVVGTPPLILNPHPRKKSIILRGDSLSFGLGTTTGDTRDIFLTQAINGIPGETLAVPGPLYREAESKSYYFGNMSLGGSSWDNSVVRGGGEELYPLRESLAYEQRTSTLALMAASLMIYWLGSNDLAYDLTLSAADAWARVVTRITAWRLKFPFTKLALCTIIKRTENAALNARINDFNNLMRANYLSIGVNYLIDFEANVPEANIVTGDTTNTLFYSDTVHATTLLHGKLGDVARSVIQLALAA